MCSSFRSRSNTSLFCGATPAFLFVDLVGRVAYLYLERERDPEPGDRIERRECSSNHHPVLSRLLVHQLRLSLRAVVVERLSRGNTQRRLEQVDHIFYFAGRSFSSVVSGSGQLSFTVDWLAPTEPASLWCRIFQGKC